MVDTLGEGTPKIEDSVLSRHPLSPTRTILDPIHGPIRLTDEEISVVNHPLFRRLHRIRQNGLLYLVFPSASHTRFEHSLGTLFVANRLLEALEENGAIALRKPTPAVCSLSEAAPGQAVHFADVDTSIMVALYRYLRLAALAHDLGHGPFSHHFDPFAPPLTDLKTLVQQHDRLSRLRPLFERVEEKEPQLFEPATPRRVKHEVMSCVLFSEVWHDISSDSVVPAIVAAIILNRPGLVAVPQIAPFIPLLHDIIASAPADADRMDYLERDSRSFGVSYGLYDRNRLLKSFLAYKAVSDDGGVRLGVKLSGARAIENFVQARFELYVQIYYHKTNRAIQIMLQSIAIHADENEVSIFDWRTIESMRDTYEVLSDIRFLDVLRGVDRQFGRPDDYVVGIAQRIYERKLWKRVYEGPPEKVRVAETILIKDGFDRGLIHLDKISPEATKGLDVGERLLQRQNNGVYQLCADNWKEHSAIIAALAKDEEQITRLYLRDDDAEIAKRMRRVLWEKQLGNEA